MLDSKLRPLIDPPLDYLGKLMAGAGISANTLTFIGFFFSLACFAALASGFYGYALILLLCSRFLDGLDGATARRSPQGPSDYGGFLDIISDMVLYAGFVFFFALGQPQYALYAAFLIFSFIGSGCSFLAYAVIAAKRGLETQAQGRKSFFYLNGLAEGTETIMAFVLICLWPERFTVIALVFGALCWLTTAGRLIQARKDFKSS